VLAARDLLAGRPDEARARLVPLLVQGVGEYDTAPMQLLLAGALLDLDDVDEAADWARRAIARAREQGWQVLLVDALRVAALIEARQGHGEAAADALQEGLALARHLGCPYAEALLLQAASQVSTQAGQSDLSRQQLEEALAIFRRLGARTDLQNMAALLSCHLLG
jgi:ATP/maltotriose-dependent transcriptional regulator MalT